MNATRHSFTLIEFLIALFIGSLVMTQVFEGIRLTMRYVKAGSEIAVLNKNVETLFSQFERDCMCIFALILPSQEKNGEKQLSPSIQEEKKENKKVEPSKEKKEKVNYAPFIARVQDREERSLYKKTPLFESISFITTSPLEFVHDKKERIVRVDYRLSYNKEASKQFGKTVYTLIRKESHNGAATLFKENDKKQKEKSEAIEFILARNVKDLSIMYQVPHKKKVDEKEFSSRKSFQAQEEERTKVYEWNNETARELPAIPERILIYLELWDSQCTRSFSYELFIPVIAFSSFKEEKSMQKQEDKQGSKGHVEGGELQKLLEKKSNENQQEKRR